MKIGAVLPCTLLYGGVKRFMELGNIFIDKGHRFTIYSPQGEQPDWFPFRGEVKTFDALKSDELDALFFTEYKFIDKVTGSRATRKIFYHVAYDKQIRKIAKLKEIEVVACSSNIHALDKLHGLNSFKAIGGVKLKNYSPKTNYDLPADAPVNILAYGRLGMSSKGTKYVVRACEELYRERFNIRLLLFDTPVNEKGRRRIETFTAKVPYEFILNHPVDRNSEIFNRADIFVAAEKKAGWCNTVAEAMACAVPVVATTSGTRDLLTDGETGLLCRRNVRSIKRQIKRYIADRELRQRLGENGCRRVADYDWSQLADRLEAYLTAPVPDNIHFNPRGNFLRRLFFRG